MEMDIPSLVTAMAAELGMTRSGPRVAALSNHCSKADMLLIEAIVIRAAGAHTYM